MLSLCIRDLTLLKNHWKLIVGYPIAALLIFARMNTSPYVMGAFMIVYMMNQYSFYYDEKNKSDKIYVSFPFKRKTIIQSRYLSLVINCIIGFILMAVAGLIFGSFEVFQLTRMADISDIVQLLLRTAIFAGIAMPLYFRFGYAKMRAINIFIFFAIFFAPSALNGLINNESHPIVEILKKILLELSGFNGILMSLVFSTAILLVSNPSL